MFQVELTWLFIFGSAFVLAATVFYSMVEVGGKSKLELPVYTILKSQKTF